MSKYFVISKMRKDMIMIPTRHRYRSKASPITFRG
eukprot:12852.XXX_881784_881888_1 [CDS] Oithona nana genome sequencing.